MADCWRLFVLLAALLSGMPGPAPAATAGSASAPTAAAVAPSAPVGFRMRVAGAVAKKPRILSAAKVAVALAGAALLAWGGVLAARGKAEGHRRLRDALLVALAVLGLSAGWNFGLLHTDHYVHYWDVYHYFFGAKYAKELGYTRLYACTSVADVQLGFGREVEKRQIRNLVTNKGESNAGVLRDPSGCTRYFTRERFGDFVRDVAWFHGKMPIDRWNMMQVDHGFNATPVWTLAGGLLANTGPASDARILALALLDGVLLLGSLVLVWWAFGWRAAAVCTIVFGTNTAADFGWIGGSFLRLDWLFFSVASLCLLKKGRPFLAGFALGWAALLRIFPVLLGAGIGVKALSEGFRDRWRFLAGGLLSAAILIPLSGIRVGPVGPAPDGGWRGFVANSRKHLGSPSINNMGLKTLLSSTPERPFAVAPGEDSGWVWWRAHAEALRKRMPLFWALLALYALLLVRVSVKQSDWVATVASAGLIPFATVVSCYYYVLLLITGTLTVLGEWWGAAACALAAGIGVCSLVGTWDYEIYVLASAVVLVFFVVLASVAGARVARTPA